MKLLHAKAFFLSEKRKEFLITKGFVSEQTLKSYGYHLDHLADYLGRASLGWLRRSPTAVLKTEDQLALEQAVAKLELENIRQEDLEAYLIWRHKHGTSQSTLSAELYAFRSFWGLLRARKEVSEDIAAPIKRKAQKYQEAPHLKEKHVLRWQAFLRALPESDPLEFRTKALWITVLKFGLRISEALYLTISDLTLKSEELVLQVAGKGGKIRRLPLPYYEEAQDAERGFLAVPIAGNIEYGELIRRYLTEPQGLRWFSAPDVRSAPSRPTKGRSGPILYLFRSRRGTRLSDDQARKDFDGLIAQADLEGYGYTPHSLRHTAASNWLQSDVDIKTVSELLGHANVSTTTTIYSHTEAKRLRNGLAKSL